MVIKLTKEFKARLMSLKTSGNRKQYEQATMILSELQMETKVSKNFRDDCRIPNCHKFELRDGYRIVFQKIEGTQDSYLALYIGSHDEVDRYLDHHKGWIFDPTKHGLKELRLMSVEDEQVNIVVSPELQSKLKGEPAEQISKVFGDLDATHLNKAGVPEDKIEYALSLSDPDSLDVMTFLEGMPPQTESLLLAYITGGEEHRKEIKLLLEGKREFHPVIESAIADAIDTTPNEFIDLRDLPEEKKAFDSYPLEDWMLFLHPDQKPIVSKEFNGPARLRGVSGSGKTVIAIHRARYFARRIIEEGSNQYVLFITFNKSLAELVSNLIDRLSLLREKAKIHVFTMDKWCRDFIKFRIGNVPTWQDAIVQSIWDDSINKHLTNLSLVGLCQNISNTMPALRRDRDIQFLEDEVKFIYGKFIHNESNKYLTCDRTGRVRRLIPKQRQAILDLYTTYAEELISKKQYISGEINRTAYALLKKYEIPEFDYRAIIIDEVQDLSEVELSVLRELAGNNTEKLFFVGDGAQRIYTRGYSMKNMGINVVGRSFVLKQNYRNTKEIMNAASMLMQSQGIGKYDDEPETSQILAMASSHTAEKPLLIIAHTPDEEWKTVAKEIKYLINMLKIQPHEICCLARSNWEREGIKKTLEQFGIKAVEYRAEGIGANDCIKVTSLHNSKGHEFKVVFIVGFFDGAIPLLDNTHDPENFESEAALLYVAMTRAKDLLYLSYPEIDQNKLPLSQSRFIDNIRDAIDIIHL
ncbi:MAG: 3'-5' exonuclease [Thermodesulfovibrionales bacterium]